MFAIDNIHREQKEEKPLQFLVKLGRSLRGWGSDRKRKPTDRGPDITRRLDKVSGVGTPRPESPGLSPGVSGVTEFWPPNAQLQSPVRRWAGDCVKSPVVTIKAGVSGA